MSTFDSLYKLPMSRSGDRALRFGISSSVVIVGDNGRVLHECRGINISRTGLLMEFRGAGGFYHKVNDLISIVISPDPRYFSSEIRVTARIARIINDQIGVQIGVDFTVDEKYRLNKITT